MHRVIPVILAGGLGSRLRNVAPDVPKPMVQVAGVPFLEWVLRYLEVNGLSRCVICTGYRGEVIEEFVAQRDGGRGMMQCVREETPLGTGGAFLHAVAKVGAALAPDAWLVLNGDSLILTPLAPLLNGVLDSPWQGGLLGVTMPDAGRYGSLKVNTREGLAGFKEKAPGAGLINGGVYLLKKELIAPLPAGSRLSMEEDLFPSFLDQQTQLRVLAVEAPFIDIGTPESLKQADDFIRNHQSVFTRQELAS